MGKAIKQVNFVTKLRIEFKDENTKRYTPISLNIISIRKCKVSINSLIGEHTHMLSMLVLGTSSNIMQNYLSHKKKDTQLERNLKTLTKKD
jgi:hypothetical protein